MSSTSEYYIVVFEFKAKPWYTLWYTDETDGFVLQNNKIKIFANEEETKAYAYQMGYSLGGDVTYIKCDKMCMVSAESIDCNEIIAFWNIIDDAARELRAEFLGNSEDAIIHSTYEKLFFGCNLPAVVGNEEKYFPQWTEAEIVAIKKVVDNGLEILEQGLI